MLLNFPSYNIYSVTLLILVLQGYLFSILFFYRFYKNRQLADLFLGLLLFVQGYHCTAYIIGFMGWYDTYETTKINYFLFDLTVAVGPLIYFYIKSLTQPKFKFTYKKSLHFILVFLIFIYGIGVWLFDVSTEVYPSVQNGPWETEINFEYVYPVMNILQNISIAIYLFFSIRLYLNYRQKINAFFSNTYKVELNWLAMCLGIYSSLFLFQLSLNIINEYVELSWTDFWWGFFANAITIYIIGMKGYYTNLKKLPHFSVENFDTLTATKIDLITIAKEKTTAEKEEFALIERTKVKLEIVMKTEKLYLNPDLTLSDLGQYFKLSSNMMSKVINSGFNKNFNEFINHYRVEACKAKILAGETAQLSLLGIAFECGFNSKATFNRTFKKLTGFTPSQFNKFIQVD
jgi:AraC-like DNA-binding protein